MHKAHILQVWHSIRPCCAGCRHRTVSDMHEAHFLEQPAHEEHHAPSRLRSSSPSKVHKGSRREFRVHGKVGDNVQCLNLRLRITSPDGPLPCYLSQRCMRPWLIAGVLDLCMAGAS